MGSRLMMDQHIPSRSALVTQHSALESQHSSVRQGVAVAAGVGGGEEQAVVLADDDLGVAAAFERADHFELVAAGGQLVADRGGQAILNCQVVGDCVRPVSLAAGLEAAP